MLIVISNPTALQNEAALINQVFDEGLQIFHLRKPEYAEFEIIELLNQIKAEYHNRIALHQHHHIAKQLNINRIHFKESERQKMTESDFEKLTSENKIISTSIHELNVYEKLSDGAISILKTIRASRRKLTTGEIIYLSNFEPLEVNHEQ